MCWPRWPCLPFPPLREASAWQFMYPSPLPAELHDTVFITNQAREFIRGRRASAATSRAQPLRRRRSAGASRGAAGAPGRCRLAAAPYAHYRNLPLIGGRKVPVVADEMHPGLPHYPMPASPEL